MQKFINAASVFLFVFLTRVNPLIACDSCGGHAIHERSVRPPDVANGSSGPPAVRSPNQPDSEPIRFVVVGDTQSSTGGGIEPFATQLMRDIELRSPDFVMFPGDLVGTGTVNNFREWNNLTGRFGNNRYMVPGNHDLPGRPATNGDWQSEFHWLPNSQAVPNVTTSDPSDVIRGIDQMDYYVDVASNVRLISVTSDRDTLPGEPPTHTGGFEILGGEPRALDWFQSVMALPSTQAMEHVFVMTHHPVTSYMSQVNSSIPLTEGTATDWWKSMAGTSDALPDVAADALFAGHLHTYLPNRPDPNSDTAEIIVGTGGGGSEGVPHRHLHGFMEVVIDNGSVTTTFFGDHNESVGGWSFTEVLDRFTVKTNAGVPRGELARYEFEANGATADSSSSSLSKGHALNFNRGAMRTDDAIRGSVLRLRGGAFADAKNRGDQNFQVLGDLRIQLWAKADSVLGTDSLDNILVAFGDADGTLTPGGNHDAAQLDDEIANYAYQLSYTADGRLRLGWEYQDSPIADSPARSEFVLSSAAVSNPQEWHQIEVQRDADNRTVRFLVDGIQLGEDQPILNLPTGGGAGSLYLGAIPDTLPGSDVGLADFVGRLDDVIISSEDVTLPELLFGDLNGDGVISGDGSGAIDNDDVAAFVSVWRTDTTGFSTGDRLRHGDLNADDITDLDDWSILNQLLNAAQTTTVVPEPQGVIWFLLAGFAILRKGRRP